MPAFDYVVKLCSVRDRSEKELLERLIGKGYPQNDAEDAVKRAVECGLVDNLRFADGLIRGRISSGKGVEAIRRDLEKFGIDQAELGDWESRYSLDDTSQFEAALIFIQNHPPKAKDAWGAAYRKIVSRGYSAAIASRVARAWSEGGMGS